MASVPGYNKVVQIKTTASTAYVSLPATTANFTLQAAMLDDTTFLSTGWHSRISGLRDYSMSGTLVYDTANSGFTIARTALVNGTKLNFKYLSNGTAGFQGTVYVSNFSPSGDVGGLETVSVTFEAAGALSTV